MSRTLQLLAVTAVAVISTGAVAEAAPTLTLDRECYVPGQTMAVNGSGYEPGKQASVTFQWNGRHGSNMGYVEVTPDSAGNIATRLDAPRLASDHDLSENGTALGSTMWNEGEPPSEPSNPAFFTLSSFEAWVSPWAARRVDPRRRTTFSFRGFEAAGPVVYAHYLLRGKLVRTVRMGATRGACGDLTVRMPQFPFRPVRPGSYTVVFDGARRWPNPTEGVFWSRLRVTAAKAVR